VNHPLLRSQPYMNRHPLLNLQLQLDINMITRDIELKQALESTTAKAIALLDKNIQDDSLYLLFEWDSTKAQLSIVVTDDTKSQDSPLLACDAFTLSNEEMNVAIRTKELEEKIYFWLHDYLTTAKDFFRYSLVAIFHASNRANTRLL